MQRLVQAMKRLAIALLMKALLLQINELGMKEIKYQAQGDKAVSHWLRGKSLE